MNTQEDAKTRGVLESPKQIGQRYGVVKSTVLKWHHEGIIPAEIVVGTVYRFDPEKVAAALKAHTRNRTFRNAAGEVMATAIVV